MGSNAHYDEKIPGNGITNARKTMRCRVRCVCRIRPVAPTGHEAWWRGSGGGSETKSSDVDEGWDRYTNPRAYSSAGDLKVGDRASF